MQVFREIFCKYTIKSKKKFPKSYKKFSKSYIFSLSSDFQRPFSDVFFPCRIRPFHKIFPPAHAVITPPPRKRQVPCRPDRPPQDHAAASEPPVYHPFITRLSPVLYPDIPQQEMPHRRPAERHDKRRKPQDLFPIPQRTTCSLLINKV